MTYILSAPPDHSVTDPTRFVLQKEFLTSRRDLGAEEYSLCDSSHDEKLEITQMPIK